MVIRPMMYGALYLRSPDRRRPRGGPSWGTSKDCLRIRRASCSKFDMEQKQHDLVVIGAGPGGYVAAIRAAQLGLNVACIEKEQDLGGTCLRIGCIPSKALLESSELLWRAQEDFAQHGIRFKELRFDLATIMRRKEGTVKDLPKGIESLFRKSKISRYAGYGRIAEPGRVLVDTGNGAIELKSRFILIATGSKAAILPRVALDGDRVATSTEALSYKEFGPSRCDRRWRRRP